MQNKLFTECQSGFIPDDICITQLLPITHEICKRFDGNSPYGVRGHFFDIGKASVTQHVESLEVCVSGL